jgi:twitching motility protein PilT
MNHEILWLIRLGLDQKLFNREQALAVLKAVGRDGQLMDFAQKLIDDGIVTDVEKLEAIAGDAMTRATTGAPEGNPLLEPSSESTPPLPVAGKLRAAAPAGAPQFPFAKIGTMDDEALAEAMRQLLVDAGRYGASDLHLSAGSKPFVRKHRVLTPITDTRSRTRNRCG